MNTRNEMGQFVNKYIVTNKDCFKSPCKSSSWVLGILSADGWVKNNTVGIAQSGDIGLERVKFIQNVYKCNNPIYESIPKRGKTVYTLCVTSKTITDDLKKFNVIPCKTLTFNLSEHITDEMMPYFLQGYIEGDGTIGVYTKNSGYELLTVILVGTKEFLLEVNRRIPIQGNINPIHHSKIFDLRWTGKKAIQLIEWMYEDVIFDHSPKFNKYIQYRNTHNPNYLQYDVIRQQAQELLDAGCKIPYIASKLNVHFQLLYKWKSNGKLL